MKTAHSNLTDQQEVFCLRYLESYNATQAAISAGYSERSAAVQGSRMLKNDKVQARIRELKDETFKLAGVSNLRLVNEIAAIAFSNITDVITEDGNIKPYEELTDSEKAAISSVTIDEKTYNAGSSKKVVIRMHDKLSALKLLYEMKHKFESPSTGLTIDVQQITGMIVR